MDRGKDFHSDVALKFEVPTGISVEPSTQTVQSGDDKNVTIKVSAAKDAPVGDHEVKVIATPTAGNMTSVMFKVKVEKSDAK